MVQQDLRSLYRSASNNSFGSPIDAVWYEQPHCTFKSKKKLILSDLVASTYILVERREIQDILISLEAAKKSRFKFKRVWADEFTYDEVSNHYFKYGIFFSPQKDRIQLQCLVRPCLEDPSFVIESHTTKPKIFFAFRDVLQNMEKIEKNYLGF